MLYPIHVFTENNREPDVTRHNRKESQNHERNCHGRRRFMEMGLYFWIKAFFPEESQENKSEHVKSSEDSTRYSQGPDKILAVSKGTGQYGVLGEKSGEKRDSRYGNGSYEKSGISTWKVLSQPSHLLHI